MTFADCQSESSKVPSSVGGCSTRVASAVIRTGSSFGDHPACEVSALEPKGRNKKGPRPRNQHAKVNRLREKLLMERALTEQAEASSIASDVSASQFLQLRVPRHNLERAGEGRATNVWLDCHPLREDKDLQVRALDR